MIALAVVGLTVAYLLYVWFRHDTFVEYMQLLGLKNKCYINEYLLIQPHAEDFFNYVEFLKEYKEGMFIRAITCPTCLSFWLALLTSIIFLQPFFCFAAAFIGVCGFKLLCILENYGG